MEFEIGGKTPGTGYDQLVLTRPAQLAGTVRLVLANGFVPSAGDRFQLVSGPPASTIGTRFELPKLPAGLSWNIGVAGGLAFSVEAAQPAAGQFAGRVSDGDGHPVAGVTVQASQTTPYGLRAQLWNNAALSGTPLVERFDAQIDNNWGGGVPDAGIPVDNFSVRWTGFVVPRFTETYAFHTISDDGVRLWIDDQLIVNNWTVHNATENIGSIALEAGKRHALRLETFENGGVAVARLLWSSPSQPLEVVPGDSLVPPDDSPGSPLLARVVRGAATDADGRYSMDVSAGTWSLDVAGLIPLGFDPVAPVVRVADGSVQTVDFLATPLSQPRYPDLVVDAPSFASPAVGGQPLAMTWHTGNTGETKASGPWVETVLMNRDPIAYGAQEIGRLAVADPLAPGATATRQFTVVPPLGLTGRVYLFVRVDTTLQVDEGTGEANNVSPGVPLDLLIGDLVVDSVSAPATLAYGDAVDVTWIVRNAGGAAVPGGWMDAVQFGPGTDGGTTLATVPIPAALAPGERYTNTATVTVPLGGQNTPGTFYFVVRADSGLQRVEAAEANNTGASAAVSVTRPPPADLAVTDATVPATVPAGQPATFVWTVTNAGSTRAVAPWRETLVLTAEDGTSPVALSSLVIQSPLDPGATVTRTQQVILPPTLAGSRRLVVTTDADDQVFETGDPANNVFATPSSFVVTAPDLVVESVSASPGTFGKPMSFEWVVKNRGNGAAVGAWLDRLVLSGPGGTQVLPPKPRPGAGALAPGASYTQSAAPVVPLSDQTRAGDHTLAIATDAGGDVGESDETNNQATSAAFRLDVPPLPDLAVLSVTVPVIAPPGGTVELVYVVTNRGKADAVPPWLDTVSVATAADPARLRRLANIPAADPIPAGGSVTRTNRVPIPLEFSGDVRFTVAADAGSQVVESDESNNLGLSDPASRVPLQVALAVGADSVAEDVVPPVFRIRVTRSGPVDAALAVTLGTGDAGRLNPPASVQIPAGQSGADVAVAVLRNPAVTGPKVVTLSASAAGFGGMSSDVTVLDADRVALSLELSGTTLAEGLTMPATVRRNGPVDAALQVVISAATTDLVPPATVTIPAGQASATFALLAADNDRLDGPRPSGVTASAPGITGATAGLTVLDNDDPGIVVRVEPGSVSEADGPAAAAGTVRRAKATPRQLTVQLASSDGAAIYVPATVVIPANALEAGFPVTAINDRVVNGNRSVTVSGWVVDSQTGATLATAAPAVVEVRDDDGPSLRLSLGSTLAREGRSPAFTAVVTRNTDTNVDLVVNLSVSDAREAAVPATVTIRTGDKGAAFPVQTLDDGVVDGNKPVTLTATSAGFATASAAFTVTDAQLPDLVVAELRAPDSGATGDLAAFGYKIRNQGFAAFAGTIVQRVYLSSDTVLDAGDLLLDETPFAGTMQPGDAFDRTLSRRLPLQAGAYHVIVVVDATDAVLETLENNNVAVAPAATTVAPAYAATVETPVTVAPSGTPVPLAGSARRLNGTPASSELVNIHIRVRGTERVVSALTDADGRFATVFTPVPGEYGKYEIGASHPGVPTAATQDQFELLGLRATPVNQFALVVPGRTNRLTVDLVNVNDRPLSALSAEVQAASGLAVVVKPPADLAAGATATATIDVSSLDERDATGVFTVRFLSSEGAEIRVGIQYNVELPVPRLVVNPASIESGVVRGKQAVVEIEVSNTGGADSGPVDLTLPDLPWFRPATPAPYPSLAPGETRKVTFLLTPDATVPLQVFEGRFALGNDLARVAVPFVFRHVSDATGDVRVLAEDELTYYGPNNVRVANVAVVLSDVYTGGTLYSGVTGPDGTLTLPGVREGTYNLELSAPKHDGYKKTVAVGAGKTNEFTGFLRTQLVRYNWKVEEIDVEEHATIRLETVFETTVPVPVVTIEPSSIDLTHVTADEYQVDLKITNQGLIAAQDVKLGLESGATWSVRTLADDLGVLPAKSTLTVPVVFTRIREGAAGAVVANNRAGKASGSAAGCSKPSIGIQWELVCGRFGVAYYAPVAVIDLGLCPPLTGVTLARDPLGWLDPLVPIFGGRGGPGSGSGNGFQIGFGTRGFTSYAGTNDCSCVKDGFQEKCVAAEGGVKGEARGAVLGAINTLLPTYAKVLQFETKLSGAAKMCTCCTEVDGQTVLGLKLEGEVGGEIEGKVLIGKDASVSLDVNVAGFSEAKAEVKGQIGLELALNGSLKAKASTECLLRNPKLCVEAKFTAKGFLGGKGSAEITAKGPLDKEAKKIGSAEIAVGLESGLSASVEGCTDSGFKGKACMEPVVFKAEGEVGVAVGENTQFVKVGGSVELVGAICNPPASAQASLLAYNPYAGMSESQAVARIFEASSPADLVQRVTGRDVALAGSASGRQLSDALVRTLGVRGQPLPGAAPTVVFEHSLKSDRAAAAAQQQVVAARRSARQSAGADGVCAQVKLLIEQQAVVTRKAIGATLEVVNESTDLPLEDLGVTVQIFDRLGNLANDRFVILDPELTRFQPMDTPPVDTYQLGGLALSLPADTTGTARWVILPKDEAAPTETTDYLVGGFMSYRVGNVVKTAEFTPGPVRVYPNAKLRLKYFHQRDVFGDDPFTPETEPAVPFVLGVMVANEGNGPARNVSITSGQPRIVDNVKGLLVNFDIIATEVAGKPLVPALTADFGDIGPGKIGIGRWLLKSSLQGLFVDYQATLVHDDRFGERGASVFAGVEIHEMIHQVEADRALADGLPDFLVNDVPDAPDDLPDTLYLSNGSIAPVTAVRTATNDGPPTADDLEVVLAAPMPSGWAYLRVPDPAAGKFRLFKVLRPDNSEVAVGTNVWVTDRTFIGMGHRPIREFNLHLLDLDSAGSYRLVYRRDESVPDTTAPTSQVAALPPTVPALIAVRWAGQDDAQGSGVASFDIYVSADGAPFARWLAGTRDSSAFYQGAAGRRYAFYSVAKDAAGNAEPAPGTPDTIALVTGNSPPTLEAVPDQSVDEGGRVEFGLRGGDQDLPGDTLTYRLVQGPAGMVVDGSTGRVTWQTGESDGPATVNGIVSVTDSGTPPLSAQRAFRVVVREVNSAPRLVLPATEFSVAEGNLLRFTATADDADLPRNPFRYRLVGTVPAGASIGTSTGVFGWTPTEAQGGADYKFAIEVNDQGSPSYTDTIPVRVTVTKVNSSPLVTPVKDRVVYEGDLVEFSVQAVDNDLPPQVLSYGIAPGASASARIDAATGRFTWVPGAGDAPGPDVFTVVVTDDYVPPASATTTFRIGVKPLHIGLNLPRRETAGEVSFRFKGQAGGRYALDGSVDLVDWQPLQDFVADQSIFTLMDRSSAAYPWRYFRVRARP